MNWEIGEPFEELLRNSFVEMYPGNKVTGIVTAISAAEIQVDIGSKQAGFIPLSGLNDNSGVEVGDEIEVYVVEVDNFEGAVELSKKRPYILKSRGSITNSDIRRICDIVSKEILTEVRENLSQMKPELVSSIVDMAVRKVDSHYLSQIEELEERISKMESAISRIGVKTK